MGMSGVGERAHETHAALAEASHAAIVAAIAADRARRHGSPPSSSVAAAGDAGVDLVVAALPAGLPFRPVPPPPAALAE